MSKLDLGSAIQNETDPVKRAALLDIQDGINKLSDHIAADPVGITSPPPVIQGVNVKVAGEMAHVTITDNNPLAKGARYFVETDTDPSFPQPLVHDFGSSRAPSPLQLPTNNDSGVLHNWYFRAYSQFPGSQPSPAVALGGNVPQAVNMAGSTNLTLLPSTGSGTAAADGRQGGSGFGKIPFRAAIRPKRSV